MKVALCLFGNIGHKQMAGVRDQDPTNDIKSESSQAKSNYTDPRIGHHFYQQALLSHYDVDIFAHSWSLDFKEEILELYKPKKYEIVSQKEFPTSAEPFGLLGDNVEEWKISHSARVGYDLLLPSRGSYEEILREMAGMSFRVQSRWYSSKRALELKKEYEEENDIKYDIVILSRYDNGFSGKLPIEQLDADSFYAGGRDGRPDYDYAVFDYWFISGTENMDKFATLYDCIHNYCLRPTFSAREHVNAVIGEEKLQLVLNHNVDYKILRD